MLDALLDAMFDPWPPFTFCCPQASRSGRRSFDSKLISLPPLDEVPVHVYRFAARVSCDSKGSERVWDPYSGGGLGAAKSEDRKGGEGKTDANLTIFFSTVAASGNPTIIHSAHS